MNITYFEELLFLVYILSRGKGNSVYKRINLRDEFKNEEFFSCLLPVNYIEINIFIKIGPNSVEIYF